jgi:hypothetical protein
MLRFFTGYNTDWNIDQIETFVKRRDLNTISSGALYSNEVVYFPLNGYLNEFYDKTTLSTSYNSSNVRYSNGPIPGTYGLYFSGSSQPLFTTTFSDLNFTGSFSVEFLWKPQIINPTDTPNMNWISWGPLVEDSPETEARNNQYCFGYDAFNSRAYVQYDSGSSGTDQYEVWTNTSFLSNSANWNRWHHMVFTKNTASLEFNLYISGNSYGAQAYLASSGPTGGSGSLFRIGGAIDGPTTNQSGTIAQVRMYNKALSSTEVNARYNAYLTASTAAPESEYLKTETTGSFITGFSQSIFYETYEDALVRIQTDINTELSPNEVAIRYDNTQGRVILSSSFPTQFIFNSSSQKILGFNSEYSTPVSVITGSFDPWFVWTSAFERSRDTEVYDKGPLFNERVADNGRTYAIGKTNTTQYRDWVQAFELKENLSSDYATSETPFTYDRFLEENRKNIGSAFPFIVYDTEANTGSDLDYTRRDGTYEMRAESTAFKPKAVFDNDSIDYQDINIKTRLLARPNQSFLEEGNVYLPTTSSVDGPLSIDADNLFYYYKSSEPQTFASSANAISRLLDLSNKANHPFHVSNTLPFQGVDYVESTDSLYFNNSPVFRDGINAPAVDTSFLVSTSLNTGSGAPTGYTQIYIGRFWGIEYYPNGESSLTGFDAITLTNNANGSRFGFSPKSGCFGFRVDRSNIQTQWLTSSYWSTSGNMGPFIAIGEINFSTLSASLTVNGDYSLSDIGFAENSGSLQDLVYAMTSSNTTLRWYSGWHQTHTVEHFGFKKLLSNSEKNRILTYCSSTYGISSSLFSEE